MLKCPSCGKEFEGTDTCPDCGTKMYLEKPKRPVGITIVAILTLLGAVTMVFSMFSERPVIFLGMFLPHVGGIIFNIIVFALSILCGIGLLMQKKMARSLYIYFGAFGILNALSSVLRLDDLVKYGMDEAMKAAKGAATSPMSEGFFYMTTMIGITIGVVLGGWMLYYVWKKKEVFVD